MQMNEVEKEVLYKFVELHRKHQDGDVLFLWVQAGGKVASQQSVQADLLPCGHSVDSLGGFGGCNPNGSCMECAATSR